MVRKRGPWGYCSTARRRWGSDWRLGHTQSQPGVEKIWETALRPAFGGFPVHLYRPEQQEKSAVGLGGRDRGQIEMGEVHPAGLPFSIHSQMDAPTKARAVQEAFAKHRLYAYPALGSEGEDERDTFLSSRGLFMHSLIHALSSTHI